MTDTQERTKALDALHMALFDALGYKLVDDVPGAGVALYRLIFPNGGNLAFEQAENRARYVRDDLPDWPRDEAAALALCLEIARDHKWTVEVTPHHATSLMASFMTRINGHLEIVMIGDSLLSASFCATPAEALARLALEALAVRERAE
jgi:hypothetical protein